MEATFSQGTRLKVPSILSFHSPITRMPDVDVRPIRGRTWTGSTGWISNIKRTAIFNSSASTEANLKSLLLHTHTHTTITNTTSMVTTFEIPKSPSSQLKTVLDYLDLVKVLNLDEIEKLFTDDFVQNTFPSSLNVPPRTKQEDIEFLRGLSEQLEGRHLQVRYSTALLYCYAPSRRSSLPSRPLRAKRCD
jgi:hypothetical protein